MARKRFTPEQIITMLRDEVLFALAEAEVLVEAWQKAYDQLRPHRLRTSISSS
jgi:hypothetical protein